MNIRSLKRWELFRVLAVCQAGEDKKEKSEKLRHR
jgi:hypothetical protein